MKTSMECVPYDPTSLDTLRPRDTKGQSTTLPTEWELTSEKISMFRDFKDNVKKSIRDHD